MKKFLILIVIAACCVCLWMPGCGTGSNSVSGFTLSGTGGTGGTGGVGGGVSSPPTTVALAYVAGSANNFFGVKVDSSSTASPTAGSPYSFNAPVNSLAVRNNLLFISANSIAGSPSSINGYKADAFGALTQLSLTPINGAPMLAYERTGNFLYAGSNSVPLLGRNATAPGVYGYSVNQSDGVLTPLPGSPWILAEGVTESGLVVSPNGALICFSVGLANGTGNVDCYPRNPDGTINASSFFTPIRGETVNRLDISFDNFWIFAAGGANNFVFYGSLANNGSSQQLRITSIGTIPVEVSANPTASWLAVAESGTNDVGIYSIGGDGAPTAGKLTITQGKPISVTFSQNGAFLFVSTDIGTSVYSFNISDGALTLTQGSPVLSANVGTIAVQ
jgi:hypothetical protein